MRKSRQSLASLDQTDPSLLDRLAGFAQGASGDAVPATSSEPGEDDRLLPPEWQSVPVLPRMRTFPFRWSVVVSIFVFGVAAAWLITWYGTIDERRAEARSGEYASALEAVDSAVTDAEPAMAVVADSQATLVELDAVVPVLTRLRAATDDLTELARRPLPSTPPLAPRDAVEALQPTREQAVLVAARADLITSRVTRILTYRILQDRMFLLPSLPREASEDQIGELSLGIAGMMADSVDVLSQLPTDPLLDDHRRQTHEVLDWLRDWDISYLDSLRRGESSQAVAAADAATSRIAGLEGELDAPLTLLGSWAIAETAGLRHELDRAALLTTP